MGLMSRRGILPSRDVAQPGRALAWGARGRQFKSARPDQSTTYEQFPRIQGFFDPLSRRNRLLTKIQQFIRERQYLHNVSPATVSWHTHSLKWLGSESPTADELKQVVLRMREKGLRPTGCNSAIRSINAYLKWSGSALTIPQMKEPHHVLPAYTSQQIQLLLNWKPKKLTGHRLSTLVAFLADTGCRIDEALSLHWKDIDFDNMLVLLHGKGSKDRLVPISLELRKRLFLFQRWNETRMGWSSEHWAGRSRDAGTFSETSKPSVAPSDSSRQNEAFTRCATPLQSTTFARAEASSTSRRCLGTRHWK